MDVVIFFKDRVALGVTPLGPLRVEANKVSFPSRLATVGSRF